MPRSSEFSYRTRTKNLETLAREQFDTLIVGGGITGAGVARDAGLRGLRVALVERRDFAVGTSSRSSKLIHGGLRYLQQGDVGLVMEAAHERRVLRRLAPHLARPIQVLVTVRGRSGYAKISAGLWTFDRMARVLKDERNQMLSRDETLALEPLLRPDSLYGAGMYYEYLTDDARLVLENIKSAASLGAVITNYTEVTGLVHEGTQLCAAVVKDATSGTEFTVRAKTIVNAAGPWVDAVRLLQDARERPRLRLTKGIHLVLLRERLPVSHIVVINTADQRSIFVVPHGEVVYIGTTDTDYQGPYDDPAITLDDARYLLDAANATFAIERLGLDDVVGACAGLRPLLHQEGKKPTEISRKDEIMVGPSGLISIAGGKLTTYRKMAERVVDMVAERLSKQGVRLPKKKGDGDHALLSGGETGDDVAAFATRLRNRWPEVAADIVDRLVTLYGSNAERLVEAMAGDPALAQRCAPDGAVTRGEVAYAVREEMALTLEDFLERRARLTLWDPHNGLTAAPEAARWMGRMLAWNASRIEAEITGYQRHVRAVKTFSPAIDAVTPSRVAHA
jgi:glycerol-3-phosphate dehydrogenase